MERAVSAELDNTATIITKTGIFDTVDKLYKTVTGGTATAGAIGGEGGAPPPPGGEDFGGGAPPPAPEAGGAPPPIPESARREKNKLILETTGDDFDEDDFLDFQKMNGSLGLIENELSKLLSD